MNADERRLNDGFQAAVVLIALLAFVGLPFVTSLTPETKASSITQPVPWGTPGAIGATTPNSGAFTTVSATGVITSTLATGTAPLTIASTTPVANLAAARHPLIQFCGTAAACSPALQTGAQIVYGTVALTSATPSTATITGISPAFTSNTSYKCALTSNTATRNLVAVSSYVSGSSFTITGPDTVTDVITYICVGT